MMQSERSLLPGPGYGTDTTLAAGFGSNVHAGSCEYDHYRSLMTMLIIRSVLLECLHKAMCSSLASYWELYCRISIYGLLSQKNAEIRRLELKLQRQRQKTSRNDTSNDQARIDRTSEITGCDPRKKCTGNLSNIRAVVTDIRVKFNASTKWRTREAQCQGNVNWNDSNSIHALNR